MIPRLVPFLAFATLLVSPSLTAAQEKAATPQWIWLGEDPAPEQVIYLRKTFQAPKDLKKAILIATCDNSMSLRINGEPRPLKSERWESPVVENISDRLKKGGENLLAIDAKNAGGSAGFLAQVIMETASGVKTVIVSDDSWQVSGRAEKGWFAPGFKPKATAKDWVAATVISPLGAAPWEKVSVSLLTDLGDLREPQATPVEDIRLPEGFEVELLYSVPKGQQGSWVAMTQDDQGRLIVSDQYGAFYRMTPPKPGEMLSSGDIEKIEVDIGGAQGLLCAFDSLYAVLNTGEHGGRGLYRITDSNGDDRFDKKELLRKFEEKGGEHGPHAVLLGPDGKSLYVVCGNQTAVTKLDRSRVPQVWDEDQLLERPYGRGFMKGVPAPGGWIAKTDPDGKEWELIATGFRNEYDAAFNREGELFTFDADMEWDMNTPWYRPTRINHVVSGAEFGWRNGGGKFPAYYPDSVGAVVDVGPGSPTGVCFGYGAKFPQKYRDAFYALDWSYGKLYAVHLEPKGGSYSGKVEEFISAQPLPLTDILIGNQDGAMYFTIGGRRVQSGLYRVTYDGDEPVGNDQGKGLTKAQKTRLELEKFHGTKDPKAIATAWPHLSSKDRSLRFAARIAIEHQPVKTWQDKALTGQDPIAATHALIALARHGDKALQPKILARLNAIDWAGLTNRQRVDLTRAYALAFTRMGEPSDEDRQRLAARLTVLLPGKSPELNIELLQLLCYLQVPAAAEKGIALLKEAPSQEEQIAYAKSLRHLKEGWNRELRSDLFQWFVQAAGYKGGASFGLFVKDLKRTALENTPEPEKVALKAIIEAKPKSGTPQFTFEPREFVQAWKVEDLDDVINVGLEGNRDFANGRKMFGAGTCFACHRFNQEGGAIGPDLTSVSGKFSPRDLLESIIEPSKEISDQYGSRIFTKIDGTQVVGRVMNLSGDVIKVNTNMMDPNLITDVDRKQLQKVEDSKISMMPPGLLFTLSKDDVLDLLAYLLSAGNPDDPIFQ